MTLSVEALERVLAAHVSFRDYKYRKGSGRMTFICKCGQKLQVRPTQYVSQVESRHVAQALKAALDAEEKKSCAEN